MRHIRLAEGWVFLRYLYFLKKLFSVQLATACNIKEAQLDDQRSLF